MRFELLKYTEDNLLSCLADPRYTLPEIVCQKRQTVYLDQYFSELGARRIVVEHEYVDRDYLQDYAAYYDRCFPDYARKTRRLHFFDRNISAKALSNLIMGLPGPLSEKVLQKSYLGFVVVRPLPLTVIGRTCLKTYGSDNGRRVFPSLRVYPVNFFGIRLEVLSLAFQEQDTVVAACATSALWTCFHGTGKLFQHSIPAPVEITDWASSVMPEDLFSAGARAFPNSGLTARQMAHAIKQVELDPVAVRAARMYSLNSVAYAYLMGRIPSLLACQISSHDPQTGTTTELGAHAVAIIGFSLRDDDSSASELIRRPNEVSLCETTPLDVSVPVIEQAVPPAVKKASLTDLGMSNDGFRLRASRIDKLYVHDDQNGPFARMEWCVLPYFVGGGGPTAPVALKTSWSEHTYASPEFVLLPLYHKIRIPFSLIQTAIRALDAALEELRRQFFGGLVRAEWDIYLTTAGDYKASIRDEYLVNGLDPESSLYADLPRFMWRVILRSAGEVHAEMLFDATGIEQANLLVHSYDTGREFSLLLSLLASRRQSVTRGANRSKPLPLQAEAVLLAFL